jgi:hypothetical protein
MWIERARGKAICWHHKSTTKYVQNYVMLHCIGWFLGLFRASLLYVWLIDQCKFCVCDMFVGLNMISNGILVMGWSPFPVDRFKEVCWGMVLHWF